jgi:hypothetical protein
LRSVAERPALGRTKNNLVIAQEVLRAVFPELTGDVSVTVDAKIHGDWLSGNPVRLTVHQYDATDVNLATRDHARDVLAPLVLIRSDGLVNEATFSDD